MTKAFSFLFLSICGSGNVVQLYPGQSWSLTIDAYDVVMEDESYQWATHELPEIVECMRLRFADHLGTHGVLIEGDVALSMDIMSGIVENLRKRSHRLQKQEKGGRM